MFRMKDSASTFTINYTNYNLSKDCLFCSTSKGFIIYNINPFRQLVRKYIEGGLNFGTIYRRTNIFFLVGTGINSDYPTNRLIVWDEQHKKKLAEISISQKIENFSLTEKLILIKSRDSLYIYDIYSLEKHIDPISISSQYTLTSNFIDFKYVISYPLTNINNIGKIAIRRNTKYFEIKAHNDQIQKLSISPDNKMIATCSVKGNLIKLFNDNNNLINTFNRGYYSKSISYLGFSKQGKWLICATEYGSVHFFDLETKDNSLVSIFRERSTYVYKVNDIIIDCVFDEVCNFIYFNSMEKIYTGLIKNDELKINQTYLLIIEKDPFSLSPKYLKNISK